MDPIENNQSEALENIPEAAKQITSFGWFSPVVFLVALLGFFLVFTDVNCNGTKLDSIRGIELVRGYKQDMDIMKDNTSNVQPERYDPNIFALNAFLAAIIGIIIFLIKKTRRNYLLTALVALIGFICMIALMLDLKTKIADAQKGNDSFNIDLNIEFEMKLGYWLVTFCFLVAAYWNFMKLRATNKQNKLHPPGADE